VIEASNPKPLRKRSFNLLTYLCLPYCCYKRCAPKDF